jgi:glycerophosphoryl diester phosphodiesterase
MVITGCQQTEEKTLDVQGHRGCRGLLPENSIPGFVHALELGVNTLELDLCISKDMKVIVSHEPWMSHEICSKGFHNVTEEEEKSLNLFQMNYEEIREYNCGGRPHKKFPDQEMLKAQKPMLEQVFLAGEQYAQSNDRPKPQYNIEIKRKPEWDNIFCPPVKEFVRLVLDEVKKTGFSDRICIQSFDMETLRLVKSSMPEITVALLIGEKGSPEDFLKKLGFDPDIYSPYYQLINRQRLRRLHKRGIKVIPWTVNDPVTMHALIKMGVDGIITDYPNRLLDIVNN